MSTYHHPNTLETPVCHFPITASIPAQVTAVLNFLVLPNLLFLNYVCIFLFLPPTVNWITFLCFFKQNYDCKGHPYLCI